VAKPSVFFLHNIIAPYRLPVFEAVAEAADIDVYFCLGVAKDRRWSHSVNGYNFKHRILRAFRFGPFVINPGLPWRLLTRPYDIYLVGDFPEAALSTFITIVMAKLRRKPVVIWSETIDNDVIYYQHLAVSTKYHTRALLQILTGAVRLYRRMLLPQAKTYVALSQAARRFLVERGMNPSRIYSGIQVVPAAQLAEPTVAKDDSRFAGTTLVLYLGYFNLLKGIDQLISAFRQLEGEELRLLIVGAGPEEDNLKALAEPDPRIVFAPYAEATTKANYYSWADLLVLPTLADCWGLVVNEALHYDTPIAVSQAAGAAELIQNGRNGVLTIPNDPGSLAETLRRALRPAKLAKLQAGAAATSGQVTDARIGAAPIVEAILAAAKGAKK
jgi:glycosyltransferase involved in cell wall biosynthesis